MKARTSMLTYYKIVIKKVSFCEKLTAKEYRKALSYLSSGERRHFREWFMKRPFVRKTEIV